MTRWLIVFCDAKAAPGNARLSLRDHMIEIMFRRMRPGFGHCFAARPLPGGPWLVVEPLSVGLDVHIASADFPHWFDGELAAGRFRAVWANAVRQVEARFLGLGVLSCVRVVEALLGRKTGALTPYQLYRNLTREEEPMGGFFGGAPKAPEPDTSYIDEQRAKNAEKEAQLERENDARRRSRRGRAGAGRNLLRFDPEAGAPASTGDTDKIGG
ncbi:hypothetical protein [Magnetospirillum sp. UT-4]|uniref:hypothetical protein n=1 Tax=Magnetospirillum sp. UT-4 TaxID=2681467 RepID=UPI001383E3F5|nr:hypothetical protein [Magnetospirillum sp. UT-4]CAA7621160.1 hypothetical protein MTBUT4_380028 [Magnetospirillum sp. UT-4]